MGERYVWGKYGVYYLPVSKELNSVSLTVQNADSSKLATIGENITEDTSDPASWKFTGSTGYLAHGYFTPSSNIVVPGFNSVFQKYYSAGAGINKRYWYAEDVRSVPGGMGYTLTVHLTNDIGSQKAAFYEVTKEAHRDSLKGNVSSSSPTEYPTESGGGISNGFWYVYKGSDSIDPAGISYPTEELRPGDQITVSITESNSNTYGGTISYLYQYQLNGGSWTDIQTTTAASISFTVPASAKTLRFRARAQDNMGFTSTTYVTGATAGVERLNLWAGVNGKARKGAEMYIGVNGKARKVTAAYVGVNGKARRFL